MTSEVKEMSEGNGKYFRGEISEIRNDLTFLKTDLSHAVKMLAISVDKNTEATQRNAEAISRNAEATIKNAETLAQVNTIHDTTFKHLKDSIPVRYSLTMCFIVALAFMTGSTMKDISESGVIQALLKHWVGL